MMIKSRRLEWTGNIARMVISRGLFKILVGRLSRSMDKTRVDLKYKEEAVFTRSILLI